MKRFLHYVLLTIICMAAYSCGSGSRPSAEEQLAEAEQALKTGRVSMAQQIADSLLLGPDFDGLNTLELCRLSLLYINLADENFPETNTSMAARALGAAYARDSVATSDYIYNQLPLEQRPAVALVSAIVEARNNPASVEDDSLFILNETIE